MNQRTIRQQLAPLIRARGPLTVARAAKIAPSVLYEWLGAKRNRRLGDRQIDAIAQVLGVKITLSSKAD